MDRGLKLTKPGVSLEKEPGRTGILGSRPFDLDLVVQICSARVLIVGVHAGSDGSGEMGCAGRRRDTAGAELRGGARPEKAIPAFPWPIRVAIWLWSKPGARVIYWDY